jgi:GST-like protein
MIDLYFWPTGNGKKTIILLEELGLPYTIKPINIGRGDQLTPDFLKISPNGRMPAIVDHEPMGGGGPISIFESGPIMMYLAEKTVRFWPQDPRSKYEVAQWVGWQLANQGPKLGEQGHFRRAAESGNNGDLSYALRRFDNEAHRIYGVMNLGLFNKRYLAAGAYTIADMICYPWASSWATRKIEIDEKKSANGRPSRKQWRWGRSSGRIRHRSAPRSRPAAENSWLSSGRSRFPRSGSALRRGICWIAGSR